MPEGDTIYRSARRLHAALQDETITDVQTRVRQLRGMGVARMVGQRVAVVESRGKHLLMWLDPGDLVVHTHMGMTGSWHLYRHGQRWQRPERQVTLAIHTQQWVAVAFNVPVCELLGRGQVERHRTLGTLGPDALAVDTDLEEARRRLDERPERAIADALLDQRVLAGVGNVYKSEVLFVCGVNPWTRVGDLDPHMRTTVLSTAEQLLKANVGPGHPVRVTTGAGVRSRRSGTASGSLWVYGRTRRPCRRCGTAIRARRQGDHARTTYWCPTCQRQA